VTLINVLSDFELISETVWTEATDSIMF